MPDTPLILVVDDSAVDRRLILAALARAVRPNRAVAVEDGVEALDYLRRRGAFQDRMPGRPAVVLLDLNMPRVNGFDVLRQLREDRALSRQPVVVFSSSSLDADVARSYQLGANAFVVKPANGLDGLTAAINAIVLFWLGHNEPPPEPVSRADTASDNPATTTVAVGQSATPFAVR